MTFNTITAKQVKILLAKDVTTHNVEEIQKLLKGYVRN